MRCRNEHRGEPVTEFLAQVADKRFRRLRRKPCCARIKAHRKTAPTGLHLERDKGVDHGKRQVVDGVDPAILKDVERGRQPGARRACDEDQSLPAIIHEVTLPTVAGIFQTPLPSARIASAQASPSASGSVRVKRAPSLLAATSSPP